MNTDLSEIKIRLIKAKVHIEQCLETIDNLQEQSSAEKNESDEFEKLINSFLQTNGFKRVF